MTQEQSPIHDWLGILILILMVLTICILLIYVRSRTRKGWNDEPDVETMHALPEDEDNSILEWWRFRNEQEFK